MSIHQVHERLVANANDPIDAHSVDVALSRQFVEQRCCSDPEYLTEVTYIKSNIPSTVNEGTVASYLYGCFQPEISVEIACTPACSTGFKNPSLANCSTPSYQKKNDMLIKLNDVNDTTADIFIDNGQNLNSDDYTQLKNDGIKTANLYYQDGNTINYVLNGVADVENGVPSDNPPPDNSQNWAWILIIIIIIAILLIVIAVTR